MSKPDWCPQEVWDKADICAAAVQMPGGEGHASLREELAEALMDLAIPKWQPVSTAPRDGTRVLVERRNRGISGPLIQKRVAIAAWRRGNWTGHEGNPLWHIEICANHYITNDSEIVAWMPLPEPAGERQ